ncbi:bifunctional alpha/beta hydrolase/class I SAM-dependent methyltransferase [Ignatzschineria sp. LJL83]
MRIESQLEFMSHDGEALFYRHWSMDKRSVDKRSMDKSDHSVEDSYESEDPSNRKAIILFHRGHEHSGRIAHLVEELNLPDYQFFAWDSRGCGKSPGERGDAPSFGWMVHDAEAFYRHILQEYQLKEENIIVIAQSVGAVIAATWVHDYVPKIRGLILASPAFRVKLYVPFAIPGLKLMYNIRGNFFVNSYVKSRFLTHDKTRQISFDSDALIARPISTRILLDLAETSKRIVADAASIHTPTQLLISGSDYVVRRKPQMQFFKGLSSDFKEIHLMKGFYHDTIGEENRHLAIEKIEKFIAKVFQQPVKTSSLIDADKQGYTFDEAMALMKPERSIFKKIYWAFTKKSLKSVSKISEGVKLGIDTGFDSGSTLDYVYRNQASGETALGRYLDYLYLQAIGWRGIRQRKVHLEQILKEAIETQQADGKEVNILDIAAGHGRYVLETVNQIPKKPASILLRDYSELNVEKGTALIAQKGLSDIALFEQGNAFSREELVAISPKPTISIVSGLFELFSENALLQESLSGLSANMEEGNYLIYTNQPWHPQLEYIARALTSHREGQQWVMRRRTQLEMDELVESAGFTKVKMLIDEWGIFSVSIAVKNSSHLDFNHRDL